MRSLLAISIRESANGRFEVKFLEWNSQEVLCQNNIKKENVEKILRMRITKKLKFLKLHWGNVKK